MGYLTYPLNQQYKSLEYLFHPIIYKHLLYVIIRKQVWTTRYSDEGEKSSYDPLWPVSGQINVYVSHLLSFKYLYRNHKGLLSAILNHPWSIRCLYGVNFNRVVHATVARGLGCSPSGQTGHARDTGNRSAIGQLEKNGQGKTGQLLAGQIARCDLRNMLLNFECVWWCYKKVWFKLKVR